jgi:hypothetical protein
MVSSVEVILRIEELCLANIPRVAVGRRALQRAERRPYRLAIDMDDVMAHRAVHGLRLRPVLSFFG